MFGLGPLELVLIGAIAVMLYGKRLPEVGRSFGRTLGDLRRQWQAMSQELESATRVDPRPPARLAGRSDDEAGGVRLVDSPRFEPPPAE